MPLSNGELQQLYCEYRQQLFTCALAITRSAVRAEDAVHDAFCQLLRARHTPENVKAYVFRAVRNAAIDQLRRDARGIEPLTDFIFDEQSPAASAEDLEFQQRVIERMQQLSADERETIVQHLYGDLTFQEISTIRDAPLGTVVSWYRRGIEKLKQITERIDGRI